MNASTHNSASVPFPVDLHLYKNFAGERKAALIAFAEKVLAHITDQPNPEFVGEFTKWLSAVDYSIFTIRNDIERPTIFRLDPENDGNDPIWKQIGSVVLPSASREAPAYIPHPKDGDIFYPINLSQIVKRFDPFTAKRLLNALLQQPNKTSTDPDQEEHPPTRWELRELVDMFELTEDERYDARERETLAQLEEARKAERRAELAYKRHRRAAEKRRQPPSEKEVLSAKQLAEWQQHRDILDERISLAQEQKSAEKSAQHEAGQLAKKLKQVEKAEAHLAELSRSENTPKHKLITAQERLDDARTKADEAALRLALASMEAKDAAQHLVTYEQKHNLLPEPEKVPTQILLDQKQYFTKQVRVEILSAALQKANEEITAHTKDIQNRAAAFSACAAEAVTQQKKIYEKYSNIRTTVARAAQRKEERDLHKDLSHQKAMLREAYQKLAKTQKKATQINRHFKEAIKIFIRSKPVDLTDLPASVQKKTTATVEREETRKLAQALQAKPQKQKAKTRPNAPTQEANDNQCAPHIPKGASRQPPLIVLAANASPIQPNAPLPYELDARARVEADRQWRRQCATQQAGKTAP